MPVPIIAAIPFVAPLVLGAAGGAYVWNKVDDDLIDPIGDTRENITKTVSSTLDKAILYGVIGFGAYQIAKKKGYI